MLPPMSSLTHYIHTTQWGKPHIVRLQAPTRISERELCSYTEHTVCTYTVYGRCIQSISEHRDCLWNRGQRNQILLWHLHIFIRDDEICTVVFGVLNSYSWCCWDVLQSGLGGVQSHRGMSVMMKVDLRGVVVVGGSNLSALAKPHTYCDFLLVLCKNTTGVKMMCQVTLHLRYEFACPTEACSHVPSLQGQMVMTVTNVQTENHPRGRGLSTDLSKCGPPDGPSFTSRAAARYWRHYLHISIVLQSFFSLPPPSTTNCTTRKTDRGREVAWMTFPHLQNDLLQRKERVRDRGRTHK